MERKREALGQYLDKWYAEGGGERRKLLDEVVSGQKGVSLRTFDWFVTNYAARKSVAYEKDGRMVVVNSDYKDLLKCFHKAAFDSFKRRGRSKNDDSASLRQKNFFRWAIQNGVVDYVIKNVKKIEGDMVESYKTKKAKKKKRQRPDSDEEKEKGKPKKSRDGVVTITQKIVSTP